MRWARIAAITVTLAVLLVLPFPVRAAMPLVAVALLVAAACWLGKRGPPSRSLPRGSWRGTR
jgi:hypothetical protein